MAKEHVYEQADRKMKDGEIIKRTLPYIKPYIPRLTGVLVLMLLTIGFDLVSSVLPGKIIERLSVSFIDKQELIRVFVLCGATFLIQMANVICIYFSTMSLQKIGQDIIYDLRMDVYAHINSMSISQINEIPVGSLVTRVTSDTNSLSNLFTNTLVNLIKNLIMLIGVIATMFVIDWRIALVSVAFMPFIAVASYVFRKFARSNYRVIRHGNSVMNAFLNENISGMKITQIFNQEKRKEKEFMKLNGNIYSAFKKQIGIFAIFRPLITFLFYLCMACVFGFGLYFLLKDVDNQAASAALAGLSDAEIKAIVVAGVGGAVGTIQIFYSLVSKFFNPIQNLADQLNELQRAFTSSERLFNLMDNKPDFVDEPDAIEIESFKGEIEFKNVWFAYKEGEWVLKDVSFHVLPKQTVAFVGATGAGKTTILQLIVRNYDVNQGEILIDGINVKKIKLSSLRKAIGQMLQDVFLFSGTIKSNINLRDDSITDEDIRKAIEYVNADSFIDKLPSGLEEQVTEGGKNFSSGQRQLLSFARTVVHKPQILILDEATANIDTETEQVIQQSLLNMMNIGTMLIVAHRLSTIQHSDNIICLQKGEIVEQGDHQTLLKNHGYYYNLYRLQYEDQER